jgi:LacI family transcriptional regulator
VLAADPLPGVYTDDDAVMRLAVEHLVDRGFHDLAFCPVATDWSAARCEAFLRHAARAGCGRHVFEAAGASAARRQAPAAFAAGSSSRRSAAAARAAAIEEDRDLLGAWLESLPKPVGIVAAYDVRGVQVLEVCRERGLAVPEDVAVVGIDDDDVLCEIATPALTSVAHNLARIGFEACRLLDEMASFDSAGVSGASREVNPGASGIPCATGASRTPGVSGEPGVTESCPEGS